MIYQWVVCKFSHESFVVQLESVRMFVFSSPLVFILCSHKFLLPLASFFFSVVHILNQIERNVPLTNFSFADGDN